MNFLVTFARQPLLWFVMFFYAALPVCIAVYIIVGGRFKGRVQFKRRAARSHRSLTSA